MSARGHWRYWRLDLRDESAERVAFAEVDKQTGDILDQFCIVVEGGDVNHPKLSMLSDPTGTKPITRIDLDIGWKQTSPEDFEQGREIKQTIYLEREQQERATAAARCARCGGSGNLASTGELCPDCEGKGALEPSRLVAASR